MSGARNAFLVAIGTLTLMTGVSPLIPGFWEVLPKAEETLVPESRCAYALDLVNHLQTAVHYVDCKDDEIAVRLQTAPEEPSKSIQIEFKDNVTDMQAALSFQLRSNRARLAPQLLSAEELQALARERIALLIPNGQEVGPVVLTELTFPKGERGIVAIAPYASGGYGYLNRPAYSEVSWLWDGQLLNASFGTPPPPQPDRVQPISLATAIAFAESSGARIVPDGFQLGWVEDENGHWSLSYQFRRAPNDDPSYAAHFIHWEPWVRVNAETGEVRDRRLEGQFFGK